MNGDEIDAERADVAVLHDIVRADTLAEPLAWCTRHGYHRSIPGVGCPACDTDAAYHTWIDRHKAWRTR